MVKTNRFRIDPGDQCNFKKIPSRDDGGMSKEEGRAEFVRVSERLVELQELLYAEGKHSLLVVFQAMDAGGKDSTIRQVFGPLNPQGCRVSSFKVPTSEELGHDYLWRIHKETPRKGMIRVFNRSHYEDVGVVRVKNLVPKERWGARYEHINAFERLLADEGTTILKFYLHISKDYQKERLQRRLDRPDKHWKFNPGDLDERKLWEDYREAYEDAIRKCSKQHAPWYVIPSERRWFRSLAIATVVMEALEALNMKYPEPDFDPAEMVID